MTELNPSMRLKVRGDTFFLPDPEGGVYFRNNSGSFSMEGSGIDKWIEKLLPVFNGEHTLHDLTDGLTEPYRERIYEITEKLYRNGFLRDTSQDRPHQLTDGTLHKYASQIELLNSLVGDSGAYHFQCYRESKVLAIGSGPFLVSLVAALFESGLPKVTVLITTVESTNRQRLAELAAHARESDSEVSLEEVDEGAVNQVGWREIVAPYDSIMYVSQAGDVEELRAIHRACREEGKAFVPAVFVRQAGLAGPLVHPDSEGCWESLWRRLQLSALEKDPQLHSYSMTAGALLANVIVFEWFKKVATDPTSNSISNFYLLNLETLEGNWHTFVPHPLVSGNVSVERIHDVEQLIGRDSVRDEPVRLFASFDKIISAESGIFSFFGEGDLQQMPLAQCRIHAADPLSPGPAEKLPEIVAVGLTHEQARREAGLAGIEAYAARLAGPPVARAEQTEQAASAELQAFVGVGAGATVAESIGRGLQQCLENEFRKMQTRRRPLVASVRLGSVDDELCRYYLQGLTDINGELRFGLGEEVCGFPTVWVVAGGQSYNSVGLNVTAAMRKVLEQALQKAQNQRVPDDPLVRVSSVTAAAQMPTAFLNSKGKPQQVVSIEAYEEVNSSETILSALQTLKLNGKQAIVYELLLEPHWQKELAGLCGVLLREEDAG